MALELLQELVEVTLNPRSNREDAIKVANLLDKMAREENKLQEMKNRFIKGIVGKKIEYEVTSSLETIVDSFYYLKEIGVEDIGKVVSRLPQVLEYSVKYMDRRRRWLEEIGVEDIGKVVSRLPAVLEYSVEYNMKPKFEYLTKIMGLSVDDIEKIPALLGYSLNKRIKPRWEYVLSKTEGITDNINLVTILYVSDGKFVAYLQERGIETSLEEFLNFKNLYK